MGLLDALTGRPFRGARLLRRAVVELRGIRRALERQADVLELANQREGGGGRTFRGYSRERTDRGGEGSTVSYVDPRLADMLRVEGEVSVLLGRDPTEAELEQGFRDAGLSGERTSYGHAHR